MPEGEHPGRWKEDRPGKSKINDAWLNEHSYWPRLSRRRGLVTGYWSDRDAFLFTSH